MKPRLLTREKDVQRAVRRLYEAVGCVVYVTATTQTRPTRVSPGLADLIVFHPKVGVFFHEVKTDTGRLQKQQRLFALLCGRCRVKYVCGGVQDVYRFLWVQGILAGGQTLADQPQAQAGIPDEVVG